MFNKVLIVCIGNICRSPVAEAIFKKHFEEKGHATQVHSAGIAAMVNYPADPFSVEVSQTRGYDLSAHKAQQLTSELLIEHDLILVMEQGHIDHILERYPFTRGKVHLLGKWQNKSLPDPYRKPKEAFEVMFKNVYDCSLDWLNQFWA